jgi:hypothetical protein
VPRWFKLGNKGAEPAAPSAPEQVPRSKQVHEPEIKKPVDLDPKSLADMKLGAEAAKRAVNSSITGQIPDMKKDGQSHQARGLSKIHTPPVKRR